MTYHTAEEKAEIRAKDSTLMMALFFLLIPGIVISVLIKTRFYHSHPPKWFMHLSSILCFLMAVAWINFAAGCVVDLLKVFGFITTID